MDYKIEDIEGISAIYGAKLREQGITSVEALLEKGAAPKGRDALAKATGISEKLILKWTNHADLFRINGIGPEFSELLEASGVDTVKELRNRVAANLYAKLVEVNAKKKLTRRLPSESQIADMIEQAKKLPPKMTY
ncbi:MAG: DUF4332 domain-containing protein [Dysgonamonadaceae bacterium]|jgi:predicted flap endonuclease-1-like 5' DNA nuclease|nr:DUF4332 domain-containing protein [Dysgonamonadaceae bacterium]